MQRVYILIVVKAFCKQVVYLVDIYSMYTTCVHNRF